MEVQEQFQSLSGDYFILTYMLNRLDLPERHLTRVFSYPALISVTCMPILTHILQSLHFWGGGGFFFFLALVQLRFSQCLTEVVYSTVNDPELTATTRSLMNFVYYHPGISREVCDLNGNFCPFF